MRLCNRSCKVRHMIFAISVMICSRMCSCEIRYVSLLMGVRGSLRCLDHGAALCPNVTVSVHSSLWPQGTSRKVQKLLFAAWWGLHLSHAHVLRQSNAQAGRCAVQTLWKSMTHLFWQALKTPHLLLLLFLAGVDGASCILGFRSCWQAVSD